MKIQIAALLYENGRPYHGFDEDSRVISGDGLSMTIKANYPNGFWIMENKPKRLYNIYGDDKGTGFAGNVYDTEELSPALQTMEGGNRQPLVEDKPKLVGGIGEMKSNKGTQFYQQDRIYDSDGVALCQSAHEEFNPWYKVYPCLTPGRENKRQNGPRFRGENEEMFTLTSQDIHGVAIKEEWLSQKGVNFICDPKRGMTTDVNPNVAQPLTAKGQQNWTGSFISPDIESLEKSTEIGSTEPVKINLASGETITSDQKERLKGLRIRKLTPKECWRLMGWDDESFAKAAKVNSNSQLYKQAGNGIVVQVLEGIFKELL